MSRILVAGAAYGGENVGDDAILKAIVEQIRSVDANAEITAVTRTPEAISAWLGIRTLDFTGVTRRLATYLAVFRCDVLVVGGGAMIAAFTPGLKGLIAGHPGYPMTMLLLAKLLGKKTMVYAVGVEEIESRIVRSAARRIFSSADVFCVRDEDSRKRLVRSFGVDPDRVEVVADPVLGMTYPPEVGNRVTDDRVETSTSEASLDHADEPLVVINFAFGLDRREALVSFFAQIADYVIEEYGARVLFIPMNLELTADRRGMERALEEMRFASSAEILQLPYRCEEVLEIVAGSDLVISSRMHLLIFAALTGTPILGISRSPKVDAFLDHYGLASGADTRSLDFSVFRHTIDEAWRERARISRALDENRARLRVSSLRAAELLRELVSPLDRRA